MSFAGTRPFLLTLIDASPDERLPHRFAAYLIALVSTGVAIGLRWMLDPVLGDTLTLVTVYLAVAVSVWLGGCHEASA